MCLGETESQVYMEVGFPSSEIGSSELGNLLYSGFQKEAEKFWSIFGPEQPGGKVIAFPMASR